ncbi:MAG: AEC family transporter [Oligoflexales bacterium]
MTFLGFSNTYVPFISLVGIGYCLARWAHLNPSNMFPLIRYLFLPVIIYNSVSSRIPVKTLTLIVLSGAAVTALSKLVFEKVNSRTSVKVSSDAAFPNVAYFTFPLIAMIFGSKGFGTASSFLIGSFFANEIMKSSNIDWRQLIKEPIVIATVLGIVIAITGYKIPVLGKIIRPVYGASFSIILIYLGTLFHPFGSMNFGESLASVLLRMGTGFAAAFVAIKLFSFNGIVSKTIMLCALSPPGAPAGESSHGSDSEKLGVIVCFIFIILMNHFRWTPWSIRF